MKIVIGTTNKAKVTAVKDALKKYNITEFIECKVPSDVSDQPLSFEETKIGALNRAKNAMEKNKDAHFALGLEGGLHEQEDGWYLVNWGALVSNTGETFLSGGISIKMPAEIIEEVLKGIELADVMDAYTSKNDVRQNEGAVGVFTKGVVTRKDLFIPIVNLLYGQYNFAQSENKVR